MWLIVVVVVVNGEVGDCGTVVVVVVVSGVCVCEMGISVCGDD